MLNFKNVLLPLWVCNFYTFNLCEAMNIVVNNQDYSVESRTLTELIAELSIETKGVAIALNNRVIPRVEWGGVELSQNDKIVIVSAVFGG